MDHPSANIITEMLQDKRQVALEKMEIRHRFQTLTVVWIRLELIRRFGPSRRQRKQYAQAGAQFRRASRM
jgi:hypothetical protein